MTALRGRERVVGYNAINAKESLRIIMPDWSVPNCSL